MRSRILIPLFIIVSTIWVVRMVDGYLTKPSPEAYSFALNREADVFLRGARIAEERSAILGVVLFSESLEADLEVVISSFEEADRRGLLDKHGETAYKQLRYLRGDRDITLDVSRITDDIGDYYPWFWEAELLRKSSVDGGSYEYIFDMDRDQDESIRQALWWSFILPGCLFLIGLPFVPKAIQAFKLPKDLPARSPVNREWMWVLVIMMLGDLVADEIFKLSYLIPDHIWGLAPMGFHALFDTLWRLFVPCALILLLFWRKLGNLPEALHLNRAPKVAPVLGMMSLAILFNFLLYYVACHLELGEWGTTSSEEDGVL